MTWARVCAARPPGPECVLPHACHLSATPSGVGQQIGHASPHYAGKHQLVGLCMLVATHVMLQGRVGGSGPLKSAYVLELPPASFAPWYWADGRAQTLSLSFGAASGEASDKKDRGESWRWSNPFSADEVGGAPETAKIRAALCAAGGRSRGQRIFA